ncbi:MAG: GGDEF domain-containing protein [Acidobacteria bacterium]|nr:GGDEF domain-containing protein [Acidobacteriota bacterium]
MEADSKSFSQQLRQRMSVVEKRDWELWGLAIGMVAVLTAGLFFVLLPPVFLGQNTFYVQARLSPQLLLGLLILVLMLLTYLIHKQIQVRAMRFQSIQEAWNFQMTHVQLLIDPLTQALNRSALEELLGKEIKRAQRSQTTLVFLYVDINDFKQVNTRYGHLSGDLVLTEVGGLLKQCVRGSDYVIRMGGDEFLVALVDTDEPGADVVKNRIRQLCERWNLTSPLPGYVLTLSIGVQVFDANKPFDEVLAEADSKMYSEKKKYSVAP